MHLETKAHLILIRSFAIFLLLLGFIFPAAVRSDDSYTGQMPPAQLGAACNESTLYHWSTETKTPWEAMGLLAVPDGYTPAEWEGTPGFINSWNQIVSGDTRLSTMAGALLTVWGQSFQASARLYVMSNRSVTTETRDVTCTSGTWQIPDASVHIATVSENSQWVSITDDPASPNGLVSEDVEQAVNGLLANVNSQPGADTRPFHSYTNVTD